MPAKEPFIRTVRTLVECYQAFEHYSSEHVRGMRLTPAQFDIVATLGNTQGLNFKELGERTLITKGTLTGVIDRMEKRGLVERKKCERDARVTYVCLTSAGERTFNSVFPEHVEYMRHVFERIPPQELEALRLGLQRLRDELQRGGGNLERAA